MKRKLALFRGLIFRFAASQVADFRHELINVSKALIDAGKAHVGDFIEALKADEKDAKLSQLAMDEKDTKLSQLAMDWDDDEDESAA